MRREYFSHDSIRDNELQSLWSKQLWWIRYVGSTILQDEYWYMDSLWIKTKKTSTKSTPFESKTVRHTKLNLLHFSPLSQPLFCLPNHRLFKARTGSFKIWWGHFYNLNSADYFLTATHITGVEDSRTSMQLNPCQLMWNCRSHTSVIMWPKLFKHV